MIEFERKPGIDARNKARVHPVFSVICSSKLAKIRSLLTSHISHSEDENHTKEKHGSSCLYMPFSRSWMLQSFKLSRSLPDFELVSKQNANQLLAFRLWQVIMNAEGSFVRRLAKEAHKLRQRWSSYASCESSLMNKVMPIVQEDFSQLWNVPHGHGKMQGLSPYLLSSSPAWHGGTSSDITEQFLPASSFRDIFHVEE